MTAWRAHVPLLMSGGLRPAARLLCAALMLLLLLLPRLASSGSMSSVK
jgi:hypothetical protein